MNLKDDRQQNIQMQLDLSWTPTGEAREAGREETESAGAMNGTENPASTNRLMEEVCERENLKAALQRVKANKGSPGVDGMTVIGIKDYLKQHWSGHPGTTTERDLRAEAGRGPWYLARAQALAFGLSNAYFKSLGLPSLFEDC
jgi:hypothetical protein